MILIIAGTAGFIKIGYDYFKADQRYQISKELYVAESNRVCILRDTVSDRGNEGISQLQKINRDVTGWLSIKSLELEYPIVKGEDNEFYLTHAYEGSESIGGSIMMNCDNSTDFSDRNTMLYGHDMRDSSMFGSLKELVGREESGVIAIQTAEEEKIYRIFCIAEVDQTDHIFQIESSVQEFIGDAKGLQSNALYWDERQIKHSEYFLTLITCSNNKRLIVIGGK